MFRDFIIVEWRGFADWKTGNSRYTATYYYMNTYTHVKKNIYEIESHVPAREKKKTIQLFESQTATNKITDEFTAWNSKIYSAKLWNEQKCCSQILLNVGYLIVICYINYWNTKMPTCVRLPIEKVWLSQMQRAKDE